MHDDRGRAVIASAIERWPSRLEDVVLGTSDPEAIVGLLDAFAAAALGTAVDTVAFYRRGVGAVFGLVLDDGRDVVVKVHRPDLFPNGIEGCRAVQRRLAEEGLPAPMPLGDLTPVGNGIGAAEEMIDAGAIADAHDPSVRNALAAGLHAFVRTAAPMVGSVDVAADHPFDLPRDRLWPTPHDLRFDFTLPNAEWVDDAARRARSRLDASTGERVIGHVDWRTENLRFEGTTLVAIFDWDSVCISTEPALVGATSSGFTADWDEEAFDPYPSIDEMEAFVAAYEAARGSPFEPIEREALDAARVYALAYKARCEHSDVAGGLLPTVPGDGWLSLLRQLM